MEKQFNLVDEAWIPVQDIGNVSLKEIFSSDKCRSLGGDPLAKIAVMKLLLAIAQRAETPVNASDWTKLGKTGISEKCLSYLTDHHEEFWLYGGKPFLQYKECAKTRTESFGKVMPHIACGNTSVLTQIQLEKQLTDADKALILLEQMSLCFGGKGPDKSLVLTKGYEKKSAAPGPALSFSGLLHCFLTGNSIRESVWLNMMTIDEISSELKPLEKGIGIPPWEKMPAGEDDPIARDLKQSLMGRLIPLARFCFIADDGFHFTEGIRHPTYKEGICDPSSCFKELKGEKKMLWVNPEKNTWRDLPAMLSFLDTTSGNNADSITCLQIQNGFKRMFQLPEETTFRFGVWCGGVKVSSNAGEQYLTGSDDAVESETFFDLNIVTSAACFDYFRQGMNRMEKGANVLYSAVSKYEKAMNNTVSQDKAKQATGLYWQMIEPSFQLFVNFCDDEDSESIEQLFTVYKRNLYAVYDQICPHGTARQFESWIKNKPIPWALQNTNKNNGG